MMRISLLLSALCLAGTAHADATLDYQIRGEQGLAGSQIMQIADNNLRLFVDEGGRQDVMLFDADAGTLTVVDDENRSYVTLDAAMAGQMQQGMKAMEQQMRTQMEAQMEGLSGEEREAMEQMMSQMMEQFQTEDVEWRIERTGQQNTVNGFDCQVVKMYRNDELQQQMCVAGRQALGLDKGDYETTRQLFALLQRLGGKQAPDLSRLEGLPVRVVEQTGQGQREARLQTIDDKELDPALFQVPEGYTRDDPMAGMPTQ